MGARKTGDKYNYEAAAFLKINKVEYSPLSPIDFTELSFNPDPQDVFSHEFNQEISIDLLVSNSSLEYIVECKHSDLPRPLSIASVEVKEAILEFIGLESYRQNQFRTLIYYVLIVNMPKQQLERERLDLRNSPEQLPDYIEKLLKQAKIKWKGFDKNISSTSLLTVLNDLIIIQIDDGSIEQTKKDKKFWGALKEIEDAIPPDRRQLIPFGLRKEAQIRLTLENDKEKLLSIKENKYVIEVSSKILNEMTLFQSTLRGNLIRATAKNLAFLKLCNVESSREESNDLIALLVTRAVNDLMTENNRNTKYICIFYPKQYDIYFAEKNWALAKVKELRDETTGKFSLLTKESFVGSVPPYVSTFLIKETKRIMEGIIVDDERIVK